MSRQERDMWIRLYEPGDAPALFEAARESISEVFEWQPWCHPDYRIEEAEQWLRDQQATRADGSAYEFAILDAAGEFLGGCGLNEIDPRTGTANLGYWLRSSARGRGVATRAVGLLADWAFAETELMRLEILCAVDNVRSQRVAERSGAVREGIVADRLELHGVHHDAVVYSIHRPETFSGASASRPARKPPGPPRGR